MSATVAKLHLFLASLAHRTPQAPSLSNSNSTTIVLNRVTVQEVLARRRSRAEMSHTASLAHHKSHADKYPQAGNWMALSSQGNCAEAPRQRPLRS